MKKYNSFYLIFILIVSLLIIISYNVIFLESQKSWVAEGIFSENKRFLNFTYGPLYLIYLNIIRSIFDYPYFIKVELIFSSSIFFIFFYNFLNLFLKKI